MDKKKLEKSKVVINKNFFIDDSVRAYAKINGINPKPTKQEIEIFDKIFKKCKN